MALKRNLIANYLGQGWAALMGLAFVPLYIKYLGIETYGLIGLFAVLQAWLSLLDMGMTPTLVREMARFTGATHRNESIRDLLRSIEIMAAGVALLIVGGVSSSSYWIATEWLKVDSLPVEVVAQSFIIMGWVTALRFVEGVYRSAIVGLQRQVLLNVVNSCMATLRGLGAVGILEWVSPTIRAFFLWHGAIAIATMVILGVATYASIPKGSRGGRFSAEAIQGVWRYAAGILSTTILAAILTQTDKIILSSMLDIKSWAYYSFATMIAGSLSLFSSPIHQAWTPRLNEMLAVKNKKQFIYFFHLGTQISTVLIGGISLFLIFYSKLILLVWTNDNELSDSVYYLVQILVLGKMINSFMLIPYEAQLAYGWTSLGVKSNLIAVIMLVPVMLIIVPQYYSVGAAWIWVVLNVLYFIVTISVMFSKILKKEKWDWYLFDVTLPMLSSLLALFIFRSIVRESDILFVNALILLGGVLISLLSAVMGASILRDYIFKYLKLHFERKKINE